MEKLHIKECSLEDIEKIKSISKKTFYETYAEENTEENMENYTKENFSYEQLKSEIDNIGSKFYIVENDDEVAAYMKINFDIAQTETGYNNSLEVQRIYVLQKYKGKKIGTKLIEQAKSIGKNSNLDYIWLGVWENNIDGIKFYEKQGFEKFDTRIFELGDDKQIDNLMKFIL